MKAVRTRLRRCVLGLACVGLLVGMAGTAQAQAQVKFKARGKTETLVDEAQYRRTTDEYRIKRGPASFTIPRAKVEYVIPPPPSTFKAAVRGKNIDALERIVKAYEALHWDVQALAYLLPLYVQARDVDKALAAVDKIKRVTKEVPPTLAMPYWQALLLAGNKQSTLERELKTAIAKGPRELVAAAYVLRGDMHMDKGNKQDALLEGYLRTAVLFEDVRAVRPDALRKSAEVLEAMNDPRAEIFRRKLMEEFPGSR